MSDKVAKQPPELLRKLLAQDKPPAGMFSIGAEDGMVAMRLPEMANFMGFTADQARQVGLIFITAAAKLDYAMALKAMEENKDLDLSAVLGKLGSAANSMHQAANEAFAEVPLDAAGAPLNGEVNVQANALIWRAADTPATPACGHAGNWFTSDSPHALRCADCFPFLKDENVERGAGAATQH